MDQNKHNLLTHKNLGPASIFNNAEIISSRLIFQQAKLTEEQPKPKTTDQAPTDKSTAPNAPKQDGTKPEVADQSVDAKKVITDNMQTGIRLANQNMKAVEAKLTPKAEEYLQKYFESSIDRFDADKDGKISKDEAEKYKAAMFAKTKSLIEEYAPTEAQKKATEAKNTAAQAIEAPKVTEKNLSEVKEISATMDLKSSKDEFESLKTQNTSFQSSVSASIASIQSFHTQVLTFQKAQQGWKAFAHAWDEFKHPFSESDGAKREAELKAQVAAAKTDGETKLKDLQSKKAILDGNGEKIKAAIAAERKKMIADRDAKVAEMQSAQKEQGEKIVEKKKKYDEIKTKQDELTKQQQTLQGKQAKQAEFQKNWSEVKEKEQWEKKTQAFKESKGDATAEISALKLLLDDEHLTPDQKAEIQKQIDAADTRQKSSESNIGIIAERVEHGKAIDRQLTDDEKTNSIQINSVSAYLSGQIEPALASTSITIAKLEEVKLQYATQATEVTDYYNKKVDWIDKTSEAVSDYTLTSAIGRDKSITAMESAVKSLDKLDINNRGIFMSIVGMPQGILHGIGEGMHDLGAWIDKNTGFMLDNTDGGWHVLGQIGGFFTGFLSGGVELVGGVFTMAAHPWETAKGLTSLAGYDSAKGEWSVETLKATWKNLKNAVLGKSEWDQGHYGTSAGKFVFNALSMFVGAGEAKAAGEAGMVGRATAAASKARVVAVAEAVAKGASESWTLGRGAQIVEFAKTLAIEATPKFIKSAGSASSKEVGFLSKTGAVMQDLGRSFVKGIPDFMKEAWQKGTDAKLLDKSRVWAMTKSVAGSAGKGVVNVAVFTGKIYKELVLAPVSALRATGRFVRELPSLARRIGSEGLVNAYRASKISEAASMVAVESGNYAKAREAMAEIIQKDPKLSLLAQESPAGAKAAEAQASLKLLRENPTLFDSYIKMEEATAKLNEYGTAMAEDIQSNIKKVKENPQVIYEVAEHDKLKQDYQSAIAKRDKTPKPSSASPDPKPYAAAEAEVTRTQQAFNKFKGDSRMEKVEQYQKAVKAEEELTNLLNERKELTDKYIGAPKEPLAKLEREIGEARAVDKQSITAVTDTPEFIQEARANFEKAAKTGKKTEINKAAEVFGSFEPGSELGKTLEAIKRKARGETVPIGFVDADFATRFEKPYKLAMESGNVEELAIIRKAPGANKYAQHFNYIEYKYYSETADLQTVFKHNQNQLLEDYQIYNKSISGELAADVQQVIRDKHPSLKAAFDELDLRQNFLTKNDIITHKISAVRIQSELADIISPSMKAEEAASKLRKRYEGQPMGADVKALDAGEIVLGEGKAAKTYKVVLDGPANTKGGGTVKLLGPDQKFVQTLEEIAADAKAAKSPAKTPAAPAAAPTAAPAAAPKTAPTPIPTPPEYTEYFDLRLRKATAEAELKSISDANANLPKIDRAKVNTALTDLGLEKLDRAAELFGKTEKLTIDEIAAVREKLIQSKKLDGMPINKLSEQALFDSEIQTAMRDYSASIKAPERAAKIAAEAKAADAALTAFEADSAKLKVAKDYQAQAATPAAAPASNKFESYKRYKDADQLLEASQRELTAYKKALRDQEQNLKAAQEAYFERKASGKYTDKALEGTFNKMKAQEELVAKTTGEITRLEEVISTARKDKWGARAEFAGDKAVDYLSSPLRSKWLESTVERLKKAKGIPGKIGETIANFLKEQAAIRSGRLKLLTEKGLNVARSLKGYWDKTRDKTRPLSRLYSRILDDQIILLALVSKSIAQNAETLKALTVAEKIAAVEAGWKQLALGGGGINKEEMYSDADLNYLKDKKVAVHESIDSLRGQEGITATAVQSAIDAKLGPEGNDTNKSYTVTVDSITVKVDKDGHRTYEGLEKWITDAPNKKLVGEAFREIAGQYNGLDQKSALKLNGGKAYANKEELQKQVEEKLKAQILEKIKGQDLKGGLTVYSKGRTSPDQPNYVAQITETGKVTLEINEKWAQQIYDQSTGKANPPEGAAPDVPVVVPKAKSAPGPGKKAPQKPASDLVAKGEATEPDEVSAPLVKPDATATFDKPNPTDDLPDPNDPYS